jgi:hypothetical protein
MELDPPKATDGTEIQIDLERFKLGDNEGYAFQDPGEPTRRDNSSQCAHCHVTLTDAGFASPHRSAAKNPAVHDVYAGAVAAITSESECTAAGGRWWTGLEPGSGAPKERCYLGDGALSAINTGCGTTGPCDGVATAFGGCADCHAPGIDGKLGGRNLLEARQLAYDYGVHCDVCHRVESVDLSASEPGVAGRLRLLRPRELSNSPGIGEWLPLTFGPWRDVPNPRMGSVARSHFQDGTLCAGCHQQEQRVLVAGASIDGARWPSGRLPVHTTFDEWKSGPLSGSPCPSCHMPPDPTVGNGADLYNVFEGPEGPATGWRRPPGSVRRHAWYGPRQPESRMAELAAAVLVEKTVSGGELVAKVTVKNVGCGHAIPTGEPLRSLVLLVEASCNGAALSPTGGDVVPDFAGFLARKLAGENFNEWPGARAGEIVRVVRRTGGYRDYEGFGPFGPGGFAAARKGMPIEELAGEARITAVAGSSVSFDRVLPAGDVAYRVESGGVAKDGENAIGRAGAAGFGFARVMVGADGRRMVHHALAVDVASDNRILPQKSFTTEHRFAASCAEPEVHAVLIHRAYPIELARERRWTLVERVIAEGRR